MKLFYFLLITTLLSSLHAVKENEQLMTDMSFITPLNETHVLSGWFFEKSVLIHEKRVCILDNAQHESGVLTNLNLLTSSRTIFDLKFQTISQKADVQFNQESEENSHGLSLVLSGSVFDSNQIGVGQNIRVKGLGFYFFTDDKNEGSLGYYDHTSYGKEVNMSKIGDLKFVKMKKFKWKDRTLKFRLTIDREKGKIFLTNTKPKKNKPIMTVKFNKKKRFKAGSYFSIYGYAGEKVAMKIYIDKVQILERKEEVAKNIQRDYTQINDKLIQDFIHTRFTASSNNTLLDVLINEEKMKTQTKVINKKLTSSNDLLSSLQYRASGIMESSFGAAEQYKNNYKKMLRKLSVLIDMQQDIYNKIKEGEKNLGDVVAVEELLNDIHRLEKFVDNLNNLLGLKEIQGVIMRLYNLEEKLGDSILNAIQGDVSEIIDKKMTEYSSSISSNIIFYLVILIIVMIVGGFVVLGRLKKAEKLHQL